MLSHRSESNEGLSGAVLPMTKTPPTLEVLPFQQPLGISLAAPVNRATREDLQQRASQSRLGRIDCDVCALCSKIAQVPQRRLTSRLSDAGLRCRQTKLIYLNHRLLPGLPKMHPVIAQSSCWNSARRPHRRCPSILVSRIDPISTQIKASPDLHRLTAPGLGPRSRRHA